MRWTGFGWAVLAAGLAWSLVPARGEGTHGVADVIDEAALRTQVAAGLELVKAAKGAAALAIFDEVDRNFAEAHASGPRVFCAHGPTEAALYMLKSASDGGADAVAINGLWCDAIYYKAYTLTDLGRPADAEKELDRVLKMAPDNSLYLNERAELATRAHQYDQAIAIYKLAESDSPYMVGDDSIRAVKSRACRGVGYILTQEGKLDESEAEYRRCLTIDANDQKSKDELAYIAQLRARKK